MPADRRAPVPASRFAGLPDGVQVLTEPFVAHCTVRAATPGAPDTGRWAERDGTTTIRLGPDEWLVTSPFVTPAQLVARLRARVAGTVTDTSAQRTTFRLRGAHARDVLAAGCPLDLAGLGPGAAARTAVGGAEVVLLAGADEYVLLVHTPAAAALADWLVEAAVAYA